MSVIPFSSAPVPTSILGQAKAAAAESASVDSDTVESKVALGQEAASQLSRAPDTRIQDRSLKVVPPELSIKEDKGGSGKRRGFFGRLGAGKKQGQEAQAGKKPSETPAKAAQDTKAGRTNPEAAAAKSEQQEPAESERYLMTPAEVELARRKPPEKKPAEPSPKVKLLLSELRSCWKCSTVETRDRVAKAIVVQTMSVEDLEALTREMPAEQLKVTRPVIASHLCSLVAEEMSDRMLVHDSNGRVDLAYLPSSLAQQRVFSDDYAQNPHFHEQACLTRARLASHQPLDILKRIRGVEGDVEGFSLTYHDLLESGALDKAVGKAAAQEQGGAAQLQAKKEQAEQAIAHLEKTDPKKAKNIAFLAWATKTTDRHIENLLVKDMRPQHYKGLLTQLTTRRASVCADTLFWKARSPEAAAARVQKLAQELSGQGNIESAMSRLFGAASMDRDAQLLARVQTGMTEPPAEAVAKARQDLAVQGARCVIGEADFWRERNLG